MGSTRLIVTIDHNRKSLTDKQEELLVFGLYAAISKWCDRVGKQKKNRVNVDTCNVDVDYWYNEN